MSDLAIGLIALGVVGAIIVFIYSLSKGEGFIESSKVSLSALIVFPIILLILLVLLTFITSL